jgi:hypothetical protein
MTKRQQLVIAVLATANGLAIAAVILWVAATLRAPAPSSARSVSPTSPPPTIPLIKPPPSLVEINPPEPCEWRAAELLADTGLAGTVVHTQSPSQTLRFDIRNPALADLGSDDPAQLVWLAFDVAVVLKRTEECRAVQHVAVNVLVPRAEGSQRIVASVDTVDLMAFYEGELVEARFIERVAYWSSTAPSR